MKFRYRYLFFFFIFLFLLKVGSGQTCTTLGQNPTTAFPVCGTTTFLQKIVPHCGGRPVPTPCSSNAGYSDINPFWYKFTCFSSGQFAFTITPINANDDYDWELFDITGHDPMDIYTNSSLIISANWSGMYGPTGAGAAGKKWFECASAVVNGNPTFSTMPNLIAGHNYILLVSNFSPSQVGYNLSFQGGTASIIDPITPFLTNGYAVCDGSKVLLTLNKKMKCNSLAADGSDFSISGSAANNIVKAVGRGCALSFDTDTLELTMQNTLLPGNYTVTSKIGTDNNTLLDDCGNQLPVGLTENFLYETAVPTPIDSIAPILCIQDTLKLVLKKPINCNTIATDGSDFFITGPASVNIKAAKGICNNGFTDIIQLILTSPIKITGSYQIHVKVGTDGNTILNECGKATTVGSTLNFNITNVTNANFTTHINTGCSFDTINLFHDANNGANQWNWQLDNGSSSSLQNPIFKFNQLGKVHVLLTVSNGYCSDSSSSDIILPNFFPSPSITVSNVSSICQGNVLTFNTAVNGGTQPYQYTWLGPNGFNSNIINPSISNITSNASGNYSVIVTDNNGCSANFITSVNVKLPPIVNAITGPNGGCVGSSITLTNSTANGIWSSNNPSVATIDPYSGKVNFISAGSTTIQYDVTGNGCTNSVTYNLISNSVSLHPDIIECNNGITHFNATDNYYGVTYSNSNSTNTFLWSIIGGPFTYQETTTTTSQYPSAQLQTGNTFLVNIQFTSNGVSCNAQQKIYRNTGSADTIISSHDTTICSNTSPIALKAAVSSSTNAFQWSTNGTGSFSNVNGLNTTYTPSMADKVSGIVKIYFSASSNVNTTGSCGIGYGKDSMILRIYPPNIASNTSQTICSNQVVNFIPNSSIPGSFFSWSSSISSGVAYGNSGSGTSSINDSLVNGSNVLDAVVVYNITAFAFTPTHATCIGDPFNYTVSIKAKPSVIITNNTTEICSGNTINIKFNTTIAGSTYTWNSSVIKGVVNGNSSNVIVGSNQFIVDSLYNVFNSNSKVRYYINAISSSGCIGTDSTDVLIFANPTTANAGTDQVLCNDNSSILSANIPGIGIGNWDQLSGPTSVNFGTASSPFSTITGLTTGTYQLKWSITNGSCNVSKDTVQLVIFPISFGGIISSDAIVCEGSNSNNLTLSGSIGQIVRWEFSTDAGLIWTTINNTTTNYTYNNLTQTTLFRAIVQSGNCSIAYSNTVTITVNALSKAGTVTADTNVCINSNSGTLQLNGFTGSIQFWEYSTDAGTTWPLIKNTTNRNSFTNLTATTLYRAVVQNGICATVKSNYVTVTVSPPTIPGTLATNATVCANSNNGLLLLSGYTGAIVNWESSNDNGNSWSGLSNTSSQNPYNNLSASTSYRVLVQSGSCPAIYSNTSSISVLQPVTTSNAGPDQVLCNNNVTSLSANISSIGTGFWSALLSNPTTASIINTADPNSLLSGLATGSYQFVWTISNGQCFTSKDTVVIKINAQTIPGSVSGSNTVCKSSNTGNIILTGYIGNIVNWESSIDNGNNWTIISNNTNSLTYNNLTTTTIYRAAVQSGSCAPLYSNNAIITVLSPVSIALAGPDQAICNTTVATLAANMPTSGTGSWSALSGNPTNITFTNIADPNTTINGLLNGSYMLVWTIDNGVCTSSKDTVQIIVYPETVPGILSADATVCASSNNGTISLNGYSGAILQWESSTNGSNWNAITNTNNSQNYSNLTSSTNYRVSVKNAVCPSLYSNLIRISVSPATTIANAGPDTTLINGFSSYKLEGNMPGSGVGVWTVIPPYGPSNLIFTDTSDPTATIRKLTYHLGDSTTNPITPPSDGVYHLKWTITNSICPSSESNMVVTVQPPTNPGIVRIDTVACTGNNSGFISVNGYFGNILQWEDSTSLHPSWNIISRTVGTNQDSLHYDNLTSTTYYRALVKNGVGLSLYSGIAATITILDAVTKADAGKDSSICNTSSIQLWGNRPTSGTGTWSYIPGGPSTPSFSNLKNPNAILSGLTIGTYQFIWTIANGSCNNSIDTVKITIDAPTIAGTIISSNTVCDNNNSGTLYLNGYTGSVLSGNYSTDNGLNWFPVANTANKNSFVYTNLPSTTKFRAEVKNGSCPSLFTNIVTITVLQTVTKADAGIDQKLCNQTTTSLSANTALIGTGKWTSLTGNPSAISFTNPHDPRSSISGLITGTYQFVWTISNVLCTDSKDTVQVSVYTTTNAGHLSSDAIVCANTNSNTLILSGFNSTILQWESSINNGGSWNVISNNNSTYQYSNLNTTTKFRALVQNNICPSIYSNIVNIQVLQPVTIANAGLDQKICNLATTTLAANTASSGTGFWTSLSNNPSLVNFNNSADPNTIVSGLIPGTYQFVWTITNTLCSTSKDTVQIVIYPNTIAGNLVADKFVCADANSGKLTLSGYLGNIRQWESSIDNGINWISINTNSDTYNYTNLISNTKFRAQVQNGPCNIIYSNEVHITVNPISNPGILSSSDTLVCANYNSGSMNLKGYTGSIIHWELSEDNGKSWTIVDNSSSSFYFTNLTKSSIWRVLVQNGVCATSYSNALAVSTNLPTVAGSISGNATVCFNTNSGNIKLEGNTGSILHWESSNDNGNTWTIIQNTNNIFSFQQLTTTTLYRALVQNGICAIQYSNTVKINIVQPVTIANAGNNQVICNLNTTTQLQGNTAIIGQGIWTLTNGPSDIYFNDATIPNAVVNGLVPGTYEFKWMIDNGICTASSSNVTVIVDRLKADFGLNAINNCGRTTYDFIDASKALFGIASWKWSSAPSDTTNTKNYNKSYPFAGQNKVSLTVQSNTGCIATTNANFQVKVFSVPKVNINAINEACKIQLMQLSSNLNSKDSIFSILWNLGNGINSKDSTVTVQYFSEGKYTVKLLVSTINNCYDSTYKSLIIHPLPTVVVPSNNFVCKGDTLNIIATGAMNYIWMDQQNNIVCNSCESIKIFPNSNSSYSVIGYNQYGCSQITNTSVTVVQPFKIQASLIDTICLGSSLNLTITGAESYTWLTDPGLSNYYSHNPVATPKTTTTYTVIGRDNYSCFTDTAKINLVVGEPTLFNLAADTAVQAGVQFMLVPNSNKPENIRRWQWTGNAIFTCDNCQTTVAKVSNDAEIICTATNLFGCKTIDTISIKTFCPNSEIFIPNAFSPDGDGINDMLFVQGSGIKLIKSFRIYSRWGELVFEKNNFLPGDPSNGWDGKIRGKAAAQDVFVYICEAICEKGIPATFKGNVTVLK
ncbi:MAG: gliding motility-associated C-terminal domain-containing protein [Bacteroidota bacterium]